MSIVLGGRPSGSASRVPSLGGAGVGAGAVCVRAAGRHEPAGCRGRHYQLHGGVSAALRDGQSRAWEESTRAFGWRWCGKTTTDHE